MDTCEAQTFALAEHALAAGKSLYVPRCRGPRMDMVRVADTAALAGLTRNAWGIAEPSDEDPAVDPKILDFVLVPGVAFDVNGNRCGHGRGYYDRYLAMLSPDAVACAICLTEQITDQVPTNEHDIKPHMLITPEGIQYSSKD
ncbi:hypothetical protein GGF44_002680 [Coemansia sp. RSA 1694]|nr:hypothetical protein GGH95_005427 [Coemansia sp. RSA 1836]KAJ2639394.1 hypothetical protein GGF44_002680 [Coemansia sp. RSA 1694]